MGSLVSSLRERPCRRRRRHLLLRGEHWDLHRSRVRAAAVTVVMDVLLISRTRSKRVEGEEWWSNPTLLAHQYARKEASESRHYY